MSSETESTESTASPIQDVYCVIMAGGKGTRLWPESRRECPKQFLRLNTGKSMLENTIDRIRSFLPLENILVITEESLAPQVRLVVPFISEKNILIEPVGRNTAPCIGLAAIEILSRTPNAIMIVLPSDQAVEPTDLFCQTLEQAIALVRQHPLQLVTIGIKPTYPSSAFGYIEAGNVFEISLAREGKSPTCKVFEVRLFHEKPCAVKAQEYLNQGGFFWNAGIFVWNAATILSNIIRFEPQLATSLERIQANRGRENFSHVVAEEFAGMTSRSIDVAVLERSPQVVVLEAPFQWSDLGSFLSLSQQEVIPDQDGNYFVASNVVCVDSRNNIIRQSQGEQKLLALVGVEDMILVQTETITLFCSKEKEGSIKQILDELQQKKMTEFL